MHRMFFIHHAIYYFNLIIVFALIACGGGGGSSAGTPNSIPEDGTRSIYFNEGFDDTNVRSRSWFDGSTFNIDRAVRYAGTGSLNWTWTTGDVSPATTYTLRKDFTATDSLYVSFYWRFNSDWIGSGLGYHPHMIYILSDLDDNWGGLAQNYLDTYIEASGLTPRMIIQDGMNINYSYGAIPNNLTTVTESRDVAGCNGCLSGSDCGDSAACYAVGGGTYWNGRQWNGSNNFSRNTWHKVEVYFKMNTVSSGHAIPNGIMWMKVDGNNVISKNNIVYRTNENSTMMWKTFVLAPYIGDGSPQNQTMWMDELELANLPPDGD